MYCTAIQWQKVYALVASGILFVDYVDLLASSDIYLWLTLGWFAVECEMVGRRVSTSESQATVFSQKGRGVPFPGHRAALPNGEVSWGLFHK